MKFSYVGLTRQQERVRGTVDAQDEVEARMRLRAMQVRPLTLGVTRGKLFELDLKNLSFGKTIDLKGMIVFTRQFSSLIDSGVPVVQCLDILSSQEKRAAFKKVLLKVKGDIEAGSGLAEALAKHPKTFPDLFVRIVEAGEVSGTLDKSLKRVGIQLEKLGKLRSKVVGAMIYPVITLVVAVLVLVFLLVKVIPEISKLYTESAAKLPELTVKVLALSDWMQQQYHLLLIGLGVMVVGGSFLYRVPAFRRIWDPLVVRVPLFGSLIKKAAIARFTRTMSTLIASGVPLLNAFDICIRLIGNLAVKDSIRQAQASVTEGKSIAAGLGASKVFPPMVVHMVSIGEMTGRLDDLLAKVAEIYDDEVDDAVSALTGLLQPALIIIVGGIVAFLLLAMYLPIFQLAEKVTGGA